MDFMRCRCKDFVGSPGVTSVASVRPRLLRTGSRRIPCSVNGVPKRAFQWAPVPLGRWQWAKLASR